MQVETQENMKSVSTGVRKSSEGNDNNPKKNKRMKLSHCPESNNTDGNNLIASDFHLEGGESSSNSAKNLINNFEEPNISYNPNSPRNHFEEQNISYNPRSPRSHFEEQDISYSPNSPRNLLEEEQNISYDSNGSKANIEVEQNNFCSPKSPKNHFEGEQSISYSPRSPKNLWENDYCSPSSPKSLNYEMSDNIQSNDPYLNGSLNNGDNSNPEENFNAEMQQNMNGHLTEENIVEPLNGENITNEYITEEKITNEHITGESFTNEHLTEDNINEHLTEKNITNERLTEENVNIHNSIQRDITDKNTSGDIIQNVKNTIICRTLTGVNNFDNINDDSTIMDVCDVPELAPPTLNIQCNDNDNYSSNTSIASDACLQDLDDESSKSELPCPVLLKETLESSKRNSHDESYNSHIGTLESSSKAEVAAPVIQSQEHNVEALKTDDVKYLGIYDLKTTVLEGHADIVFSVAADDKVVISSSGDTTIKVWNVEEQKEIGNFAGHSDAVTSIILLNSQQSETMSKKLGCLAASSIALSASMDCHIKVWSVLDSKEIASIYTFNSITCMGYLESESYVAIGTEGGKLEVWDLSENKKLDSVLAHECSTSVLKILDNYIFTASTDGAVKVWLFDEGEIQPLYSRRRREKSTDGADIGPTQWKTLCVSNDTIFLGDCTSFLKVLDWKLGRLNLLVNQLGKDGVCEAIFAEDNILLSSSYDRNTDTAAINVWSLPDVVYVGTLTGDIQDICCLTITRLKNKLRIVSGGHQLVVWDFNLTEPSKDSASTPFSFCEIDGIGVETNELSTRSLHSSFSGSSLKVNMDNSEDKRSRCNII